MVGIISSSSRKRWGMDNEAGFHMILLLVVVLNQENKVAVYTHLSLESLAHSLPPHLLCRLIMDFYMPTGPFVLPIKPISDIYPEIWTNSNLLSCWVWFSTCPSFAAQGRWEVRQRPVRPSPPCPGKSAEKDQMERPIWAWISCTVSQIYDIISP